MPKLTRRRSVGVALETIRLPFWFGGDQYENLDAGFGPYALSRLAATTGGIYFISRIGPSRLSFDPNAMREYRPDWVSADQYEKNYRKDPIRGAVIQASLITQQQEVWNWTFLFLGANMDAVAIGTDLGFSPGSSITYAAGSEGVSGVFRSASAFDHCFERS